MFRPSFSVAKGGFRRYQMILNDTLQKHEDCLEQCELERIACERDQQRDPTSAKTCDIDIKVCKRNCDFDYGP